jgi:hypothetical protein
MALGDHYIEAIQASDGLTYKIDPFAVEPVMDIAALAALDGQEFYKECEAFEAFCEATEPVPSHRTTSRYRYPFPCTS